MREAMLKFFGFHRRAYQSVFNSMPAAQYVLGDLIEFCHANTTTMGKTLDPLELARNEGRRQVYLRIQRAINLTPEQQIALVEQKAKLANG